MPTKTEIREAVHTAGSIDRAAALLGLPRDRVRKLAKDYGITAGAAENGRERSPSPEEQWALREIARKEALERLRTEIRLRHRLAANREIRLLEERLKKRLDELLSLAVGVPEFEHLAQIEEFCGMTRAEIWRWAGENPDVEAFADYD